MEKNNFQNSPFEGEMLPFERYKLYNWIMEIKPNVVFEVGSGLGGGSTYYIAEALKNNNKGHIFTCDPERLVSKELLNSFKNVSFYNKKSTEMFDILFEKNLIPDFIFFDGPEDPEVALEDIKTLETKIKFGTYFSMHDWDLFRKYDNGKSIKSIKIREYLEKSENWELKEQLFSDKKNSDFDNSEYDSVGLCLYKYIKKD